MFIFFVEVREFAGLTLAALGVGWNWGGGRIGGVDGKWN